MRPPGDAAAAVDAAASAPVAAAAPVAIAPVAIAPVDLIQHSPKDRGLCAELAIKSWSEGTQHQPLTAKPVPQSAEPTINLDEVNVRTSGKGLVNFCKTGEASNFTSEQLIVLKIDLRDALGKTTNQRTGKLDVVRSYLPENMAQVFAAAREDSMVVNDTNVVVHFKSCRRELLAILPTKASLKNVANVPATVDAWDVTKSSRDTIPDIAAQILYSHLGGSVTGVLCSVIINIRHGYNSNKLERETDSTAAYPLPATGPRSAKVIEASLQVAIDASDLISGRYTYEPELVRHELGVENKNIEHGTQCTSQNSIMHAAVKEATSDNMLTWEEIQGVEQLLELGLNGEQNLTNTAQWFNYALIKPSNFVLGGGTFSDMLENNLFVDEFIYTGGYTYFSPLGSVAKEPAMLRHLSVYLLNAYVKWAEAMEFTALPDQFQVEGVTDYTQLPIVRSIAASIRLVALKMARALTFDCSEYERSHRTRSLLMLRKYKDEEPGFDKDKLPQMSMAELADLCAKMSEIDSLLQHFSFDQLGGKNKATLQSMNLSDLRSLRVMLLGLAKQKSREELLAYLLGCNLDIDKLREKLASFSHINVDNVKLVHKVFENSRFTSDMHHLLGIKWWLKGDHVVIEKAIEEVGKKGEWLFHKVGFIALIFGEGAKAVGVEGLVSFIRNVFKAAKDAGFPLKKGGAFAIVSRHFMDDGSNAATLKEYLEVIKKAADSARFPLKVDSAFSIVGQHLKEEGKSAATLEAHLEDITKAAKDAGFPLTTNGAFAIVGGYFKDDGNAATLKEHLEVITTAAKKAGFPLTHGGAFVIVGRLLREDGSVENLEKHLACITTAAKEAELPLTTDLVFDIINLASFD